MRLLLVGTHHYEPLPVNLPYTDVHNCLSGFQALKKPLGIPCGCGRLGRFSASFE